MKKIGDKKRKGKNRKVNKKESLEKIKKIKNKNLI